MKHTKKKSEKINIIKMNKTGPKPKKQVVEKMEDVQKLVHLLQVHQIELEHQNEELRIAHEELEVSRNKYVNLFDFSPIAYLTLDPNGVIKEVNIRASTMLGIDRSKLIGKNITAYIPPEEKNTFNTFVKTIFNSSEKHSCELKVMNKDKRVFLVRLEGLELVNTLESDRKCYVAFIDMTEYKR